MAHRPLSLALLSLLLTALSGCGVGEDVARQQSALEGSACHEACLAKGVDAAKCDAACAADAKKKQPVEPGCKTYEADGQRCTVCWDASSAITSKVCAAP